MNGSRKGFFFVVMQIHQLNLSSSVPAATYVMNDGSLYEGKFDVKSSMRKPIFFLNKKQYPELFSGTCSSFNCATMIIGVELPGSPMRTKMPVYFFYCKHKMCVFPFRSFFWTKHHNNTGLFLAECALLWPVTGRGFSFARTL